MCVPFDKFVRMLVFLYVKTIIMENNAENAVNNACQIGKKKIGFWTIWDMRESNAENIKFTPM